MNQPTKRKRVITNDKRTKNPIAKILRYFKPKTYRSTKKPTPVRVVRPSREAKRRSSRRLVKICSGFESELNGVDVHTVNQRHSNVEY